MLTLLRFFAAMLLLFNISVNAYSGVLKSSMITYDARVQMDTLVWWGDIKDDMIFGSFLRNFDLILKFKISKSTNLLNHFAANKFDKILKQSYFNFEFNNGEFKFGQHIIPFGLEQYTNGNDRIFLEDSSFNIVSKNVFWGVSLRYRSNPYNFFVSFITDCLDYIDVEQYYNKKIIISLRSVYNTPLDREHLWQLGFSFRHYKALQTQFLLKEIMVIEDVPSLMKMSSNLNSNYSVLPRYNMSGIEFASRHGCSLFQTEVIYLYAPWKEFDDEFYLAWYAQASFILTGEKRVYDERYSSFLDPKPAKKGGLLEIAMKIGYVDITNRTPLLSGTSDDDGKKVTCLFGLTWIWNSGVKLQLNYTNERILYRTKYPRDISGLGFRVQLAF